MVLMELVTAREPLPHLDYQTQIPTYLKRWGPVNPPTLILKTNAFPITQKICLVPQTTPDVCYQAFSKVRVRQRFQIPRGQEMRLFFFNPTAIAQILHTNT